MGRAEAFGELWKAGPAYLGITSGGGRRSAGGT
jgi:hypothetical protein